MNCEAARLETFSIWSIYSLDKKKLAKTGFYWIGISNWIKCHFCSIEILNWFHWDDELTQHRLQSPNCPLLWKKPCANVPISEEDLNILLNTPVPAWLEYFWQLDLENMNHEKNEPQNVLEINHNFDGKCKLCCDNYINIVLMPCKHTGLCKKCYTKIEKCPFCNQNIESPIEIFLV